MPLGARAPVETPLNASQILGAAAGFPLLLGRAVAYKQSNRGRGACAGFSFENFF